MSFESYHAHVYYEGATRPQATTLRTELARQFTVELGRWHDEPVGPHPQAMYQVVFSAAEFPRIVPWLMAHHGPLPVLIHPNTSDELGDHSDRAMWLGRHLPLKLDMLRPSGRD